MRNMEIAWAFYQIADLLEFKGEDFFKIRAYRNAARAIAGLQQPVADLYASGQLKAVPGLGKNIIAKIGEMLATGQCELQRKLNEEIPLSLLELLSLPGLGPKKIKLIHDQLAVKSLADLEQAARSRKIRQLPGMGAKTEQEILRSLNRLKKKLNHLPLGAARELALNLADYLGQMGYVQKVTVAGDIRRWTPMVSSVDLLAAFDPAQHTDEQDIAQEIIEAFALHPGLSEIKWREGNWAQLDSRWGVPVTLNVVPEDEYWYALLWSTGSAAHYRRLQFTAWQKGWRLNRHGMFPRGGERRPAGSQQSISEQQINEQVISEQGIYARLGLQYIVPELRENIGEINAATLGRLPRLLELGDIKGDLHVHSNWSDGINSIEEMVERARQKGYTYLAITDHSVSLKIARGLAQEKLLQQHEIIRALNRQWDDFHLFTGIEVDILTDGSLDYPDEILAGIDVVVASVHSGFKQDKGTITKRILSAIENEHVDIIGHPTGRLLGHREPYAVDVEELIEAAAKHHKILEINSSPDRLDLDEYYVQLARESGVLVAINTDAHDQKRLDEIIYGVSVARRAWLEPGHVANALPYEELLRVLQK